MVNQTFICGPYELGPYELGPYELGPYEAGSRGFGTSAPARTSALARTDVTTAKTGTHPPASGARGASTGRKTVHRDFSKSGTAQVQHQRLGDKLK